MLNTACLMGRLVADPELRNTQSGIAVTGFRIAVDRTYQPKGQEKQTDWIDIVAWRNTAEFVCKYFKKGSMIVVHGAIQTRSYTDKEGNKRTAFEVVADNVFFGESKKVNAAPSVEDIAQNAGVPVQYASGQQQDFEEIVSDDELPF